MRKILSVDFRQQSVKVLCLFFPYIVKTDSFRYHGIVGNEITLAPIFKKQQQQKVFV